MRHFIAVGPIPKSARIAGRRGISLIQLLLAISTLVVVSTMAIRLISNLLRVERRGIAHVLRLSSFGRLSRQFRADAHSARECVNSKPPETGRVQLTISQTHAIVYEQQSQGIVRIETENNQVVRRDHFRLTSPTIRCELSKDPASIATFVIGLPRADSPMPVAKQGPVQDQEQDPDRIETEDFRIDARLGRDVLQEKIERPAKAVSP